MTFTNSVDQLTWVFIICKSTHLGGGVGGGGKSKQLGLIIFSPKLEIVNLIISSALEVIKLEYSLRLTIKRNNWLLADTCPQAANHCSLFRV